MTMARKKEFTVYIHFLQKFYFRSIYSSSQLHRFLFFAVNLISVHLLHVLMPHLCSPGSPTVFLQYFRLQGYQNTQFSTTHRQGALLPTSMPAHRAKPVYWVAWLLLK